MQILVDGGWMDKGRIVINFKKENMVFIVIDGQFYAWIYALFYFDTKHWFGERKQE